jgi:peptide chain release factor 1
MKRIIEVRAAEGGADAQLFVRDLIAAYVKLATRKGWKSRVVRQRPSDAGYHEIALEVEGKGLTALENEAGGHRIQRIPPTEKRGRVHTSTVVVAVIDPEIAVSDAFARRSDDDFRIEWFSGSGAGGQHRNKHQNSCRVHHIPTGLSEARQGRERLSNLRSAKEAINAALDAAMAGEKGAALSVDRKEQMGTGMRGDKSVTIRFQDDRVTHHGTDKTMTASRYMKGFMDEVWIS